jgi:hypothetical protein
MTPSLPKVWMRTTCTQSHKTAVKKLKTLPPHMVVTALFYCSSVVACFFPCPPRVLARGLRGK